MSTPSAAWRDWSCAVTVTVDQPRHLAGAAGVVRDLMGQVDLAASRFRDDSDLARVNRHAGVLVPVRPLTVRLVQVAIEAARATGGAVDPTVGAALESLGYDDDIAAVRARTAPAATAARPAPGWRAVRVDPDFSRIGVPTGCRLDLGATAKAWAADEAARRIHRRFGGAVLVGIGGDLAAAGTPRAPWRIDVAETEDAPAVRIGLSHGGVATSSTLGRTWAAADGTAHHHIVDPRTGRAANTAWRTATVWAATAVRANTLSTWALVDADAAADALCPGGARLVGQDGIVSTVGPWPDDMAAAS